MKNLNKILLFLLLIFLELACAYLAFYTFNQTISVLFYIAIGFNIIPLFLLFKKKDDLAISILLLIAILIIPIQIYNGNQLIKLKEEAANLTVYLYQQKNINGTYPQTLTNYNFTSPKLANNFIYSLESEDKFELSYFINKNTSYYLNSKNNRWDYYPD